MFFALTQNLEFRVAFRSSCLPYPLMVYFTLSPEHENYMGLHNHPSFVELHIGENEYQFKFIEPFERGSFPDVNVAYQLVRLHPSKVTNNVNAFEENMLTLIPAKETFTLANLRRIAAITRPIYCQISDDGLIVECELWKN
jgi:hypothetical protein